MGAGLPLDLPDVTAEHPRVALIPILSDARGVNLILRKWQHRGRLPDAVVIEHPGPCRRTSGSHPARRTA